MKDFYKKLMRMSIRDAQSITRDEDIQSTDQFALQLYQTRVKHWQLKAIEENSIDLPNDPAAIYE